jgi:hypothetical protein
VAKTIAHTHRATVNDVLLTAVAAGYTDLFRSRGEPIEDVVLRAFVPVSLHQEQPGQARGNVDAGMLVPLPIGEPDDIRRLQTIAADTAERKKKSRPPAGSMFRTVLLQRAFLRLMPRQRFMNAYVTNVPGPPIPLYLAGAALLEIFPIVPLTANISIGVGALSYAQQFNLAVVADRNLCPDLEVFADAVRRPSGRSKAESLPPSPRSRARSVADNRTRPPRRGKFLAIACLPRTYRRAHQSRPRPRIGRPTRGVRGVFSS